MGKRTLAIKHTLEKNLFYKLFNWLRNKTSISLLFAANRKRTTLVTIHLLKERWHKQPFKKLERMKIFLYFMCTKPTYDNRLRKKKTFLQPDIWHQVTTLRLVETSASRLRGIKIYRRKKISKMWPDFYNIKLPR